MALAYASYPAFKHQNRIRRGYSGMNRRQRRCIPATTRRIIQGRPKELLGLGEVIGVGTTLLPAARNSLGGQLSLFLNYQPPRRQERHDQNAPLGERMGNAKVPRNLASRSEIEKQQRAILGGLGVMAVRISGLGLS